LRYLHEEDAIDYMLIEEMLNFAKKWKTEKWFTQDT
jgi:hypothetical protein